MTGNVYTSNGWDIIAASTQDAINAQLAKHDILSIKREVAFPLVPAGPGGPGLTITAQMDVHLTAPQIKVKDGSGRMVDVLMTLSGSILVQGVNILQQALQVTITTLLAQVEAELNSHPGPNHTDYDLIIDFKNSQALTLDIHAGSAGLLSLLTNFLSYSLKQEIGDTGKKYKVASFTLANSWATAIASEGLMPYVADFSFIQDPSSPGRSNLLVLMLSVSQVKGSYYFNNPLLPRDQNFMVLVSNKVFLQYTVLPAVKQHIKDQAKDKNAVDRQISLHNLPQQYMYNIANSGDIALNMDHDPWISSLNIFIDTATQALCLYLDAKADVTFLNIHVDAWDKSWQKINVDAQGNIKLVQVNEQHNTSSSMEWWKWLLGALTGPITLIIQGIMYALVEHNAPNLGGSFASLGGRVVQWPGQKVATLKSINLPNHVVMNLDVHF